MILKGKIYFNFHFDLVLFLSETWLDSLSFDFKFIWLEDLLGLYERSYPSKNPDLLKINAFYVLFLGLSY